MCSSGRHTTTDIEKTLLRSIREANALSRPGGEHADHADITSTVGAPALDAASALHSPL